MKLMMEMNITWLENSNWQKADQLDIHKRGRGSIDRSIDRSVGQSVSQSVGQSIKQYCDDD